MKSVKERDNLDLLELVCQLHSRAVNQAHNKLMHDAYVEARKEMESRLSTLSDNTQSIDKELAGKIWDAAELHKSQLLLSAYPPPSPDKETFINSLNLDNTQIRDGWVRVQDGLPPLIDDKDYSENVIAFCNGILMVMCYMYINEDGGGYVWANCYGDIKGDAEFDDDYYPTHWMPLPTPPND